MALKLLLNLLKTIIILIYSVNWFTYKWYLGVNINDLEFEDGDIDKIYKNKYEFDNNIKLVIHSLESDLLFRIKLLY